MISEGKNRRSNKTQIQLDSLRQELLNQSKRLAQIEDKLSIANDTKSLIGDLEGEDSESDFVEDLMQQEDDTKKISLMKAEEPQERLDDIISTNPEKSSEESEDVDKKLNRVGLEERIGTKWFAYIGISALILGVSFFLKYAFDNDWVGPLGRVFIGILVGISLVGAGDKVIKKYFSYGQVLVGGGITVLYLSIFSAFSFYGLITTLPAFLLMLIITVAAILLSLYYNAISLLIVAVLGGFMTPFMVQITDDQFWLFSYILLLDLAILVASIFKRWGKVNIIGLIGTTLLLFVWFSIEYQESDLFLSMFFLTMFFFVYSLSSIIYGILERKASNSTEQFLLILSASLYFIASYLLLKDNFHSFLGMFSILLALYHAIMAYIIKEKNPKDNIMFDFLIFIAIAFVTLAIPLQLERGVITVSWSVEAVLLLWVGLRMQARNISLIAFFIFMGVFFRLFMFDFVFSDNYMFLFNETFFIFLFVIFMLYVAAYICQQSYELIKNEKYFLEAKHLMLLFLLFANFLTVVSISREITYNYKQEINKERILLRNDTEEASIQKGLSPQVYETNRWSSMEEINRLKNKSSLTLSIFWLVYGVIMLAVGIFGKYRAMRLGGIVLLGVAILKIFLYDLWSLGTLYRIISSISLGVVLLLISYNYQRYKDKIRELV